MNVPSYVLSGFGLDGFSVGIGSVVVTTWSYGGEPAARPVWTTPPITANSFWIALICAGAPTATL